MQNAEILLLYSTVYPFRLKGVNIIMCVYCLDEFIDLNDFRTHVDVEHKDVKIISALKHSKNTGHVKVDCTNLRCRLCWTPFCTIEEVAFHLKEIHDMTSIDLNSELNVHPYRLEMDKWFCFLCEKKCPSIYSLCRHTSTHFSKHTCEICAKTYLTQVALRYHTRITHSKNYTCRKCWKEFPSKEEKGNHLRTSKRCQPFMCTTCGDRFLSWELKEKHKVQVHNGTMRVYSCPVCNEIFNTRKFFYSHYKMNHTDDCYVCTCCGMKFVGKHRFDEHVRGHTGEKMFKCDVCNKQFSQRKNLQQHIWIHNETKRFSCQFCSKQFAQKVSLKFHMKSNHPELGMRMI